MRKLIVDNFKYILLSIVVICLTIYVIELFKNNDTNLDLIQYKLDELEKKRNKNQHIIDSTKIEINKIYNKLDSLNVVKNNITNIYMVREDSISKMSQTELYNFFKKRYNF